MCESINGDISPHPKRPISVPFPRKFVSLGYGQTNMAGTSLTIMLNGPYHVEMILLGCQDAQKRSLRHTYLLLHILLGILF